MKKIFGLLLLFCFSLPLFGGVVITGHVYGYAGNPYLDGAEIQIYRNGVLVVPSVLSSPVITNGVGYYEALLADGGDYIMVVSSNAVYGYKVLTRGIYATDTIPQTEDFQFQSISDNAFIGSVFTNEGSLITGQTVTVLRNNVPYGKALTQTQDNYGITYNYLLYGINRHFHYNVIARGLSYYGLAKAGGVPIIPDFPSEDLAPLDFYLTPPPNSIFAEVVDATTENAIDNTFVQLLENNILVDAIFDESSKFFNFTRIPSFQYTLHAFASGHIPKAIAARIEDSDLSFQIKLDLGGGGVEGTVSKDDGSGDPIVGAVVQILANNMAPRVALTDSSGFYSFSNLAPVTHTVIASADVYEDHDRLSFQSKMMGARVASGSSLTGVDFALADGLAEFQGTVTTSNGNGIAGATVQMMLDGVVVTSALTAADGAFKIAELTTENYIVRVIAEGYATFLTSTNVTEAYSLKTIKLASAVSGSISGAVVEDGSGDPIIGARVEIVSGDIVLYQTLTDIDGNYFLSGVGEGDYIVRVTESGYAIALLGAQVVSGGSTVGVDFVLGTDYGALTGVVTDVATSDLIPGALVEVLMNNILYASVLTDINGEYTIEGLPPGHYIAKASADGFNDIRLKEEVISGGTGGLAVVANFALGNDPEEITGTVTAGGAAIAGATVQLLVSNALISSTVTDSLGNYVIPGVAPGSYNVVAKASGYGQGLVGVQVTDGNTATANIALVEEVGKITGKVRESDGVTSIPAALVTIISNNVVLFTVLTDASGSYSIYGIAPGTYSIRADAPLFQGKTIGVTVTAATTTSGVNFALEEDPGSITGTVTDADTTDPIGAATVQLLSSGILVTTTHTESDGSYIFQSLAPGSYTVHAIQPLYEIGVVGAVVVADQETSGVDLALETGPATLTGTVTDIDTGVAIAGATVEVYLDGVLFSTAHTGDDGTYTMDHLSLGSYDVKAYADNYQLDEVGQVIDSAVAPITLDFALQADPGIITGYVTSSSGAIEGALVQASKSTGPPSTALTDGNGLYNIENLAPGTYSVTASAETYQTQTIDDKLVLSDAETEVDFTLAADPGTISGIVEDGIGDPISSATVRVVSEGVIIALTLTDGDGAYTIIGIAPGTYTVQALAPNFKMGIDNNVVVVSDATTTADFTLEDDPGTISGVVTVEGSIVPVPGTTLTLYESGVFVTSVLSGSDGSYLIPGLIAGTYTLVASEEDFYSETRENVVVVAEENTEEDFALSYLIPTGFAASIQKSRFFLQQDRMQKLTWNEGITGNILQYNIYEQGRLIGTVNAKTMWPQYVIHNTTGTVIDIYDLKAEYRTGLQSGETSVSVE